MIRRIGQHKGGLSTAVAGGRNPLASDAQLAELVVYADPPGGGAATLQAMPYQLPGSGLVIGDVADGSAASADPAIDHVHRPITEQVGHKPAVFAPSPRPHP